MQGKFDRNVEDLERVRMEDPSWFLQQQRGFQQPFQHLQNPFTQSPIQYGYNPAFQSYFSPMQQQIPQQLGFQPGIPYGYPNVQSQFGFAQPWTFSPQSMLHSQYLSQPQLPFQQGSQQLSPGVYPQFEGRWIEFGERQNYPQRGMMGYPSSRIFHRPPRNYRRSDELIRDEICKRLALTPEIDATDVDVIVKDGEVTLRGTVDDRFEKRLVEDIIENTFGVRDLLNEIRVGTRQHEQELTGTSPKGKEK